ncbi:MAG: hypothetical protein M0Q14_01850 [Tissierellaceae bacterium]|nr:hypothetical protein [Tissierellaceae bacterium]
MEYVELIEQNNQILDHIAKEITRTRVYSNWSLGILVSLLAVGGILILAMFLSK